MAARPVLLDLFCGAGGCSVGYYRAGFDVVGVDIEPQPNYPFKFIKGDALKYLERHGGDFAAIHASPPCQHYGTLAASNKNAHKHPDLVGQVRSAVAGLSRPYVIENVVGAPMIDPIMLCGEMFNLRVIRHRLFESNVPIDQLEHPKHRGLTTIDHHKKVVKGYYFAVYGNGGGKGSVKDWQGAMGIRWMPRKAELALAIPPAYTNYVGKYVRQAL